MSRIIIPIPCHFKDRNTLCATTLLRLQAAEALSRTDELFLVGGDVPQSKGGPTLGELVRYWLLHRGVAEHSIQLTRNVYGTFSEARAACGQAAQLHASELVGVSSSWYLFAGTPIWKIRAKEQGLSIAFVAVPHTGGLRSWGLYLLIGIMVRFALLLRMEAHLESFFTNTQRTRVEGFTLDGCA